MRAQFLPCTPVCPSSDTGNMSNLFAGLFQAGQKAKEDRIKAKKDEAKRVAREEAAAARAKTAAEEEKKKKAEEKANKRKKTVEDGSDDEIAAQAPAKKKAKLSEDNPKMTGKSASKGKKEKNGKKEKRAFLDSSDESGSGKEEEVDSDGSGMYPHFPSSLPCDGSEFAGIGCPMYSR